MRPGSLVMYVTVNHGLQQSPGPGKICSQMLIRVVGKRQRTLVREKDISVRPVIWRPGRCETCSARGVTRNQGPGPYAIFLIAAKARCQRLPRPGHIGG